MHKFLSYIYPSNAKKVPSFRIDTVSENFFGILSPANTEVMQLYESKQACAS
jgi:hypothetical protein